mgnify:CR=1 FL=1
MQPLDPNFKVQSVFDDLRNTSMTYKGQDSGALSLASLRCSAVQFAPLLGCSIALSLCQSARLGSLSERCCFVPHLCRDAFCSSCAVFASPARIHSPRHHVRRVDRTAGAVDAQQRHARFCKLPMRVVPSGFLR